MVVEPDWTMNVPHASWQWKLEEGWQVLYSQSVKTGAP